MNFARRDPELIAALLRALLLSFGPAVSNSFARFAYALVLPAMREDLALSYAEAGWLNTANAIGYLAGALLTRVWVGRIGNRSLFIGGMVLTSLAILATGLMRDVSLLSVLRALGGLGGAAVFICGGTLSANLLPSRPALATTTIAIYFAGGGIGLMLSGIGLPLLFAARGDEAWPIAWQAMGLVALGMSFATCWVAFGISEPGRVQTARGALPPMNEVAGTPARSFVSPMAPLRRALFSYLCFGLGYIGYMTFIIAWMRDEGAQTPTVIAAWTLLGLASWLAPVLWSGPVQRWSGGRPLAAAMATLSAGAALPLLHASEPVMLLSAALFGSAVFSTPSAIQSLVKKGVAMPKWGEAMAGFTVVFAAGQIVGPLLAGWMADLTGSLTPGLTVSVAALIAGVLLALTQRDVIANEEAHHGSR